MMQINNRNIFCVLSIFLACATTPIAGPLHASCKVSWTFGVPCKTVQQKVTGQMAAWKTADNCKSGGERCLYTLVSATDTEVKGTHETPAKHYKDDLTFTLTQKGSACNVEGYSTSETWYAVLDYGTNYCNLHNLITGSALDKVSGYSESTDNSKCTQYSSADCNKY